MENDNWSCPVCGEGYPSSRPEAKDGQEIWERLKRENEELRYGFSQIAYRWFYGDTQEEVDQHVDSVLERFG